MGITQGRIHIHGQHRDLDDVPRRLIPPAREGSTCGVVFGDELLEFEPTIPHQGHALDDEKVLVHGLFQPSADVRPMIPSSMVSCIPGVSSLLPTLRRGGRGSPLPPRRLRCFAATLKTLTP